MGKNQWLKIPQVVEMLGVSDKTVRKWVKQKRVRSKRVRGKFGPQILLLKEDVEKYLQGSKSPGSDAVSQAIPTQTAPNPGNSADTPKKQKPDVLTPLTVLVADESPQVVKLLTSILKEQSAKVVTAADGKEALDKLRAHELDLAIIEPALPLMDGFQIAADMERDMMEVPIVFCSYLKERSIMTEGLSYNNAIRYFTKPLIGKQLRRFKQFVRSREWLEDRKEQYDG